MPTLSEVGLQVQPQVPISLCLFYCSFLVPTLSEVGLQVQPQVPNQVPNWKDATFYPPLIV